MNNNPIGVFDSGLGGLSIWKELEKQLPNESFIYFADSGNCPYGPKSVDEIQSLSHKIVRFLIHKECKLIVVACNTATAAAINSLRTTYSIPFVGIEPAIKPAALKSKTRSIGILATQGTLEGQKFKDTSQKYAGNVTVHMQIGKGLVEIVERGATESQAAEKLLRTYLQPMLDGNVDHIVLGCTHYPFLIPMIRRIVGKGISIVNPANAIGLQTKRLLERYKLNAFKDGRGQNLFFTSGDPIPLRNLVRKIKGEKITPSIFQQKL